jgi:hypothetical protein
MAQYFFSVFTWHVSCSSAAQQQKLRIPIFYKLVR